MKQVIELFKSPEQVQRTIQKVIDYSHDSVSDLKREIDEYVVTNHIRDSLDHILDWIEKVSVTPGVETGAWVSGFYGSGKSSFSKYLGYSFNRELKIDGKSFVDRFASRIDDVRTEQRLKTLARRIDAAVIMLDLASQGYGNKVEDPSEILYLHTLKKLGYCNKSLAIANLEIMLEEEGRYQEFCNRIREKFGKEWKDEHNLVMLSRGHAKAVVSEMYPGQTINLDENDSSVALMDCEERARKSIELIRRKTNKEYIFFVVDEVGQYLAPRPKQILDMDGLAKNLRNIGKGKVFIIGTAQQTLTEDNKVAAINSQQLYKLKDRFPEAVTLESSDIEEICTKRLLGKCADGEKELQELFERKGARLVSVTQLRNSPDYDVGSLTKEQFTNLYPFSPVYFRLLLSLLSELSRSTGGVGLRSAIKVVQDVLIHGDSGKRLVDSSIGRLVTAEDLYEELRLDIQHSHRQLIVATEKALDWCKRQADNMMFYSSVAKTLAITSLLRDFVATPFNVAALMQKNLDDPVAEQTVADALEKMSQADAVPVSEDGKGAYVYLSDKLVTLEDKRKRYHPFSSDMNKLGNDLVKEVFSPLKSIQTTDGLGVKVSLWVHGAQAALAEPNAPLRQDVVIYCAGERDAARKEALSESCQYKNRLFFLVQRPAKWEEDIEEVLRSRYIADSHGQDSEAEIREYAKSQLVKGEREYAALKQSFIAALKVGEVVMAGATYAVKGNYESTLSENLKNLADKTFSKHYLVGKKIIQTDTASRFLSSDPSVRLDEKNDPLQLVKMDGQQPKLSNNLIISEILNWIGKQQETVTGSRIYEHFRGAPYGWSSEAVLYVLAVLFWFGKLDFHISGKVYEELNNAVREVTKAPNKFANVGVSLRMAELTEDDLALAGKYLVELGVNAVKFTLEGINQARKEFCEEKKHDAKQLLVKVQNVQTYGESRLAEIKDNLDRLSEGNLSDFMSFVKGAEKSEQFRQNMNWMSQLQNAEVRGLFDVVRSIRNLLPELEALPPKFLQEMTPSKDEVEKMLKQISFADNLVTFKNFCASAEGAIAKARSAWKTEIKNKNNQLEAKVEAAFSSYGMNEEEKHELDDWLQGRLVRGKESMSTVKLMRCNSELSESLGKVQEEISRIVKKRPVSKECSPRKILIPSKVVSVEELNRLIEKLLLLKEEMDSISEIEVVVE